MGFRGGFSDVGSFGFKGESLGIWDLRLRVYPEFREDLESRSLNGGSDKVPLVVQGPKLGDLAPPLGGSRLVISGVLSPLI